MEPYATIIICTRNRADSLRATLAALGNCLVPLGLVAEVIISDNGSTDQTRQVVRSAKLDNMRLQYLMTAEQGKGHAYNAAIASAKGDVLISIDDDVRPDRNWLTQICQPIRDGQADAVQGKIAVPDHLNPSWLNGPLRSLIACVDHWDGKDFDLVGANMAFHRRVLDTVPAFDVELGPGSKIGLGEDTLFSMRLRKAGCRFYFASSAIVEHHFDPSRLARSPLLSMTRKAGMALGYIKYHWSWEQMQRPRQRLWTLRLKLFARQMLSLSVFSRKPRKWEVSYTRAIGMYAQYVRESDRPRKYTSHGLANNRIEQNLASNRSTSKLNGASTV